MATTKLAHQTQKTAGIPNGMRTATITAVSGSAITISVSGGKFTAGVGVVTGYAPIVGDVVAVFRQDSSWLILGPTSAVNGWHTFASLGYQNGWTERGSGFPIGQYRQTASEVQLVGQINNTSIPANPSIICSGLPAPGGEVAMIAVAPGGVRSRLSVDQTGTLRLYDSTTAGTVQICSTYPLDCIIA